HAVAFGDAERHVVEHRQRAEERGDLEGAAQAASHARRLVDLGNVLAAEDDAARRRRDRAREHVDERGLARTVRPDEGVARSRLEPEVDPVGDGQRAEALAELVCLESACSHLSTMPRMPPRAKSTTTMSSTPMPKYQ